MRAGENTVTYERILAASPGHIDDAHSICELALKRLRADILSARLVPGTKLAIRLLTATYQIGVSPLRDALAVTRWRWARHP